MMRRWSALTMPDVGEIGVAELEWRERTRLHSHLEHRDVGGGIASDDGCGEALVVREAHLDALGALDDVIVRDDVAGLVDDEAGAERFLCLRRRAAEPERVEERIRLHGNAARGRHLHDAGGVVGVDLVDRQRLGRLRERRAVRRRLVRLDDLAHGRRRAAESADRGDEAERDGCTCCTRSDEGRAVKSDSLHSPIPAEAVLSVG
jgi:hypothetical protein